MKAETVNRSASSGGSNRHVLRINFIADLRYLSAGPAADRAEYRADENVQNIF
jgi:hypothetical protein